MVHTLRHSFATRIRLIQALLGHTQIDATPRYAAVSPDAVARVRSPLDRLGEAPKPAARKTVVNLAKR